jgi:hypothetical protein
MLSHVFELLKKPVSLLTLSNIALMLVVRGLVTSFKVVLIVIAAMTGLTILLIPAIAAMFLFGRYK